MTLPKLDKNFYPMIAALADYEASLKGQAVKRVTLVVERDGGYNHLYALDVPSEEDERTYRIVERLVKTMLWVCGGYRIGVHGSHTLYERLSGHSRSWNFNGCPPKSAPRCRSAGISADAASALMRAGATAK